MVCVGIGLWRLRFNVELLDLLPPDQPTVQGLKLYQRHFTNARELIITLRAPDGEKAERLAAALGDVCAGRQTWSKASPGSRPGWNSRGNWPKCSAACG